MSTTGTTLPQEATPEAMTRTNWSKALIGPGLLIPAATVTVLFALIPLVYILMVSMTFESSFFFDNRIWTDDNYIRIWDRYLPHVWTTIRLATLSSVLNLIFGYPFAYILIRKVSYRELVRAFMVFPLFGPLYLAFGLYYILLPKGPAGPLMEFLGIDVVRWLYSEQMTVFAMSIFTFPFMVMNIGAALANVDPTLEEAARTLGAKSWRVFAFVLFPLSKAGILAGFLMSFGWNLGVFVVPILLGSTAQQRVLSITLHQKGLIQFDYGLAAAIGIVLMALAFAVTWVSLRFSKGTLGA